MFLFNVTSSKLFHSVNRFMCWNSKRTFLFLFVPAAVKRSDSTVLSAGSFGTAPGVLDQSHATRDDVCISQSCSKLPLYARKRKTTSGLMFRWSMNTSDMKHFYEKPRKKITNSHSDISSIRSLFLISESDCSSVTFTVNINKALIRMSLLIFCQFTFLIIIQQQ